MCLLLRVASSCLRKCDWGVEVLDAPELDTLLSFCADKVGLGWVSLLMTVPVLRIECDNVGARCPLGACTTHGSVVVTSTLSVVMA